MTRRRSKVVGGSFAGGVVFTAILGGIGRAEIALQYGMMFGYHKRYLRVDLSRGSQDVLPLGEDVLRCFLGGVGLGVHLLLREAPAGVDPLAAEAPLVFS